MGLLSTTNEVKDAIDTLTGAVKDQLAGLTRDLYAGRISLPQWEVSAAQTIKDAHVSLGMLGAGGDAGPAGYGRMGGNLADEYKFLDNFAQQIAAGDISEAQAVARIGQYGDAAQQAYWREMGDAADRADWEGLPVLNQVPGDGGTQCHGNCNCTLSQEDDGLHWNLNPGESCADCMSLAAGGPYRPGSL